MMIGGHRYRPEGGAHADGPNGKAPYGEQSRARNIIESTRRALDNARAAGVRIGFVRVGFSADYRECPANSPIFSSSFTI